MEATLLAQIDEACYRLYNPRGPNDRLAAEQVLSPLFPTFAESTFGTVSNANPSVPTSPYETVIHCEMVLDQSSSPYAHTFVTGHLKTLVAGHFALFTPSQKIELRNFVLNFLGRNVNIPQFVETSLAQLFCIVTKLGWFNDEVFREALSDVSRFSTASSHHQIIGVQILGLLVAEMNQPSSTKNMTRHRKTAVNFRDTQLMNIFQISLTVLKQLVTKQIRIEKLADESRMQEAVLTLMRNCLQFDFIGTNPDESSDDVGSIQLPAQWQPLICDGDTLQTIYDAYKSFPSPQSSIAMECLSMLSSTRRSIFSDENRAKFLSWVLDATGDTLRTQVGLGDANNYHEFCRMLARLKMVHQLAELADKPQFPDWIEMVTRFTIKSFEPANWRTHSVLYLMQFWARMVATFPSTGSGQKQMPYEKLENMTLEVTKGFIESRIQSVDAGVEDDGGLFSGDEGSLSSILEHLANMARLRYEDSSAFIGNVFEALAREYQDAIKIASSGIVSKEVKARLDTVEAKFTWCVHIMGACICARTPYQSAEEHDFIDGGKLIAIFQLMNVNQTWVGQSGAAFGNEKLDLSFVYFFQQFRKSYISLGESVQRQSKVYQRLQEVFNLGDQNSVLNVIVQKLGHNLRFWAHSQGIIKGTLELLQDLASGYSSVKLLRKAETTQLILANHNSDNFPFLNVPANFPSRVLYYSALCRLLFASDDDQDVQFFEFVSPWTRRFDEFLPIIDISVYNQPQCRTMLEGLFRDLRGFVSACSTKRQYMLFFDWFYPYSPVLIRGLEANYDHPCAQAILKFFNEFVQNKSQRLNFDISSPNGILLFRETSRVISTYGRLALSRTVMDDNAKWTQKYKGFTMCFNIIRWSLSGKYVNFGVFGLYDDPALRDTLDVIFQLMLSTPQSDLLQYPKLAVAFFAFLDIFSSEQLQSLTDLPAPAFTYILRASAEGLRSLDTMISSQACSTIDHIASYVFKQTVTGKPSNHFLVQRAQEIPSMFPHLLMKLLEVVLFEDSPNQWSLSRPLLPLILLQKEHFNYYTAQLVLSQLPERQEILSKALQQLMEGVEFNLLPKNRDRFTQQLLNFRREMSNNFVVLLSLPQNGNLQF
ncbi:hypothetical protein SmJEL517_g01976 [Synchytrium microbalum]|uniref:Exportin-7/Ran-binding protein 17 TPR repeats domain-containing protein n=1 Tax=Synchytrium microbalum TaxID=1806994 RepID=A0A507CCG9_9FUNG|nr:uncharacterized protein SmJEL517_g01976 [Synchytrium microbalum]TPX35726.1 hypothetical protein SmJEL517_g01976 [Synchytrium microbalum]